MHHFSLRERLGLGAAAGIFLTLGVGCYAHTQSSQASVPAVPNRPALAPMSVSVAALTPAPLEIAAGKTSSAGASITPATDTAVPLPATTPAPTVVVVHVAGAVKNPGVYKLKPGDRLCDAVHAAGGFKAAAQQDALNLADRLQDADQIYVPVQEAKTAPARPALIVSGTPIAQAVPAPVPTAPPASAGKASARRGRVLGKKAVPVVIASSAPDEEDEGQAAPTSPTASVRKSGSASKTGSKTSGSKSGGKFKNPGDGMVNLNTASALQLEKLPGVGPAMSSRILQYRAEIGRFASVEQLMDVKCRLS